MVRIGQHCSVCSASVCLSKQVERGCLASLLSFCLSPHWPTGHPACPCLQCLELPSSAPASHPSQRGGRKLATRTKHTFESAVQGKYGGPTSGKVTYAVHPRIWTVARIQSCTPQIGNMTVLLKCTALEMLLLFLCTECSVYLLSAKFVLGANHTRGWGWGELSSHCLFSTFCTHDGCKDHALTRWS